MSTFDTVLVANRGEIAIRIMRCLREMGLKSVAIYSDADQASAHRFYADYAVRLSGNTSAETYLDSKKILEAIKISKAQAVHPGYGFLSENADFADLITQAGYTFIGPKGSSMRLLGDKVEAKKLMRRHKIPVTPGSIGGLATISELKELADDLGYPLILKAASGGGGRGMQVVRCDQDLDAAYQTCRREALAYFGRDEVFAERYIENPRHIEIQVLCDSHGQGFHLNERDCSIQRRHQKLVEEAPSTFLSDKKRQELGEFAVRAALAAGYEGVGTVEFICESAEKIYFMEMNTRIQVEHTVSEEITRIDLISEQIRVAQGVRLNYRQADLLPQGWAIECRINAEDPCMGFAPNPGRISRLVFPSGPFVRVDSHLYENYEIPAFYDSMIAKIIVWGKDRATAIARMQRALSELVVVGVPTTVRFHQAVLAHEEFVRGAFNTGFIEKHWDELQSKLRIPSDHPEDIALILGQIAMLSGVQSTPNQLTASPAATKVLSQRNLWFEAGLLEG